MKRTWSRRRFVATAAAGVGAVGLTEGFLLEPRRVVVTNHRIGEEGPGAATVRLVQLSDLHLGRLTAVHDRIVERVAELRPDIVVLSGDVVDHVDGLPELEAFLTRLPTASTRIATLGNWEYWSGMDLSELAALYAAHDCSLLVNETLEVHLRGARLRVVGLDDWLAGTPDLGRASAGELVDEHAVVVAHCPAWRDEDEARAIAPALTLSGHTHGGQIAVGRWAPFRPPGSASYVSGWYRDDGPPMYVSRGLGTSVVPFRLGSVPEIASFDWHVAVTP